MPLSMKGKQSILHSPEQRFSLNKIFNGILYTKIVFVVHVKHLASHCLSVPLLD